MQNGLTFIVKTLLDLYIITFIMRFILQWVRADFHNPISQFFVRVTNPLVIPARRIVPSLAGLDTASALIILILELGVTLVLVNTVCMNDASVLQVIGLAVLRTMYMILRVYLFVLLIYIVLSWVSSGGYNPASYLLSSIAEPILKPFKRFIPSIGGFDLSPVFALIVIQALTLMLPIAPLAANLGCFSIARLL